VLDGDPAPLPKKGDGAPQFSAHGYCVQTAGSIKMTLGMAVGLGPCHVVLDGDPDPLPKQGAEPLGTEVGLSLGDIVLDGDPAPIP